jgi:hypothetical protein
LCEPIMEQSTGEAVYYDFFRGRNTSNVTSIHMPLVNVDSKPYSKTVENYIKWYRVIIIYIQNNHIRN